MKIQDLLEIAEAQELISTLPALKEEIDLENEKDTQLRKEQQEKDDQLQGRDDRLSKEELKETLNCALKSLRGKINSIRRKLREMPKSRKERTISERRRLTEMIDSVRRTKIVSSKPGSQIVTLRHKERKMRKNLLSSKSA